MERKDFSLEETFFQYADKIKELLSPEFWQNILLDCSKNELFILWYLFRNQEANMTQIAEYINVPLNTATGIISRMEKKKLVVRERNLEDKRVVTIRMGISGQEQIQSVMKEVMYYGGQIVNSFDQEELDLLFRIMNKLINILSQERKKDLKKEKVRRIIIQ